MPAHPTVRFQDQDLIRIGNRRHALLLTPSAGGRLVRWIHDGSDMLYWPQDADWSRPARIRGGNPLLFPFIGRHFVDGEAGRWRAPDGVVRALPQHGFARDLPFEVSEVDPRGSIRMALTDSALTHDSYPYAFAFEVAYRLTDDALEAEFRVENRGDTPMPFYAGHHFYFAVPHQLRTQARLSMPPARRVRQRADGSLTEGIAGERDYALDDPRLQDTFHVLDHPVPPCELMMPANAPAEGTRLRFHLDAPGSTVPWQAITTWTEREDADFYCVEPWLGLPDAIHRTGAAIWLPPGAQHCALCRIEVTRSGTPN